MVLADYALSRPLVQHHLDSFGGGGFGGGGFGGWRFGGAGCIPDPAHHGRRACNRRLWRLSSGRRRQGPPPVPRRRLAGTVRLTRTRARATPARARGLWGGGERPWKPTWATPPLLVDLEPLSPLGSRVRALPVRASRPPAASSRQGRGRDRSASPAGVAELVRDADALAARAHPSGGRARHTSTFPTSPAPEHPASLRRVRGARRRRLRHHAPRLAPAPALRMRTRSLDLIERRARPRAALPLRRSLRRAQPGRDGRRATSCSGTSTRPTSSSRWPSQSAERGRRLRGGAAHPQRRRRALRRTWPGVLGRRRTPASCTLPMTPGHAPHLRGPPLAAPGEPRSRAPPLRHVGLLAYDTEPGTDWAATCSAMDRYGRTEPFEPTPPARTWPVPA